MIHSEVAARAGMHDWGNDSDHKPLETTLRERWSWSWDQRDAPRDPLARRRPNVARIGGRPQECEEARIQYAQELTRVLDLMAPEPSWTDVASVIHATTLNTLGEKPKGDAKP